MRTRFRWNWIILRLTAITGLMGADPNRAGDNFQVEEGFTSLLDGKDVTGWSVGLEVLDG